MVGQIYRSQRPINKVLLSWESSTVKISKLLWNLNVCQNFIYMFDLSFKYDQHVIGRKHAWLGKKYIFLVSCDTVFIFPVHFKMDWTQHWVMLPLASNIKLKPMRGSKLLKDGELLVELKCSDPRFGGGVGSGRYKGQRCHLFLVWSNIFIHVIKLEDILLFIFTLRLTAIESPSIVFFLGGGGGWGRGGLDEKGCPSRQALHFFCQLTLYDYQ